MSVVFLTKAKFLEHFFFSHEQIFFLFFFDYTIDYDNHFLLFWFGLFSVMVGSLSQSFFDILFI